MAISWWSHPTDEECTKEALPQDEEEEVHGGTRGELNLLVLQWFCSDFFYSFFFYLVSKLIEILDEVSLYQRKYLPVSLFLKTRDCKLLLLIL